MKNRYIFSALSAFLIFAVAKLISYIKVAFAMGSFWTLFSLHNSIAPLSGACGGAVGAAVFFASSILSAIFIKKTFLLASFAFSGIPTLFASFYWATTSRSIRAGVPLICMALFVMHAQGAAAWPYALFWVIPVVGAFLPDSLFATALASTFTAHAVGSVIWLYATAMTADKWYALMPQVVMERLIFALGMYIFYHLGRFLLSFRFSFRSTYASSCIE